jgi:hypothetical protein
MAIEEHPMFAVLEEANKRLRNRQEFYEALKEKYPESHPLVQSAKKAVAEATKERADVIGNL